MGAKLIVRDGLPFEVALRKFRKKVDGAGVLGEIKKREHHVPKSLKQRLKRKKALDRLRKTSKENRF